MVHAAGLQEINPLADYKATFNLFYEFVKGQVKGDLKQDQYLQLQTIAEPLDLSGKYPFFSLYNYLSKVDQLLAPVPLSDQFTITDRTLYAEFSRFVETALALIEAKALTPEVIQQINAKTVLIENLKSDIRRLVREDAANWKDYASLRGIPYGDLAQYIQWSNRYGNANDIEADAVKLSSLYGDLERLRRTEYADADQREIKDAWDKLVSVGARIRYPRMEDGAYPDGARFTLPYLASLPTGDTAVFADRPVMLPQQTVWTIATTTIGEFDVTFNESRTAVESMASDWSGSVSGSYGWFSASVSASESTTIREEFSHTKDVTLGCKSCFIAPIQSPSWFNSNLFANKLILQNKNLFMRYLGPGGSLLYYPKGLILMRGFKIDFKSANGWQYDYTHDFSVGGSASARFFGIGIGGGYKRHEHQEKHVVEKNGNTLTFDDGESTLRVVGYLAQKNTAFLKAAIEDIEKIAFKP
ncbi:hypothetical protein [Aquitalea aquatilis]|uniref:hypothetical protein n=1 Tax=Aquitalea aquatilis TaxID=1537400 RepID=UPI0010BD2181|nr:hypothetical protein [Aquitalea aquatilis]